MPWKASTFTLFRPFLASLSAPDATDHRRRGSPVNVFAPPEIKTYRHEAGIPLRTSIVPSLTFR